MRKLTTKLTSIALVASFTTGLLPLALAANTGTINSDDVRLRKKASTSSASLDMLEKGDKVNVLSAKGDDWYKVAYTDEDGEHTGYISAEFVDTAGKTEEQKTAKEEKSSDSKTEQKKSAKTTKKAEKKEKDTQKAAADLSDVSLGTGTVTRGGKKYKRINLRASNSQDGDIVCKVPVGSSVEILADQDSTGWYQVRYTDKDKNVYSGYMAGDYVDTAVSSTPSTTATVIKSGKVKKVVYIRSEKSTDAKVLYKVPVGEAITVISDADSDGWYQVSYTSSLGKTYNGYMREEYVDTDNSTASALTGVVSTKRKFIYIRSEKSTDSEPLCKVPAGKTISVLGAEEDGWYQVRYKDSKGTHKGYMVSKYVKVNGVSSGTIGTSTAVLRAAADNSSDMLDVIPKDTQVNILASLGDWYQVEYDDQIGYVDSSCIGTHAGSSANSDGYGTISADSVRLRAKRSTDSGILATLTKGDTFQITSSKKGWYGTTFNGVEGYVKADYVSTSDSISSGHIQVTATPSIMLRKGAGTDYDELGTIPCGTLLEVKDTMGSWYKVEYEGKTGYVTGDYVSATTEDGFQAYPDYAKITADELSLRDKPGDEGERIAGIGEGMVVHVYDMEKGWYRVTYGDQVGYIDSDYTQEDEGPATPIPSPEEEASESEEGGSAGSTASESDSDSDSSESESSSSEESGSSSSEESESTESSSSSSSGSGSAVLSYAEQFVGNPYKWGGSSLTNGCDCSGFVMSVYAHFGKSLPHSSSADRSVGRGVSESDMQPGDIVCYSGHVGIYAGGGQLLSALGKNYGITYNSVHYKKILAVRRLT